MKKKLVIGMLANVDAGKTTLSEAILYKCGAIKRIGRVDHRNAFLDTFDIEKERGITVFSKQAVFESENFHMTLVDTPGHVDFSTEMERVLSILDLAIIIVSAADGITGHLALIMRLVRYYKLPAIIFLNKMDQAGIDREKIISELKEELSPGIIEFRKNTGFNDIEDISVLDDAILEKYLNDEKIDDKDIRELIRKGKLIPLCAGSALKEEGIDELIGIIDNYAPISDYDNEFSARVFKITRENGQRLSWLKITGGSLKVKSILSINGKEDKADGIRIYSGAGYCSVKEASAGDVCAVMGLDDAKVGTIIGKKEDEKPKFLESVMRYRVIIPGDKDIFTVYRNFMELEEENPALKTAINSENSEISVELMGNVQAEIYKKLVKERFSYDIDFTEPEVIYKETLASSVEGVGHFEPLRHYAEVHLLLEPGEKGSGIRVESQCSPDMLSLNYQKQIISILEEGKLKGVLTGSELTDLKISLIAGKAHEKHTEGGDFREATFRALRQGLMSGNNVLLEPFLHFRATVPEKNTGRLISDISEMKGKFSAPERNGEFSLLEGEVPASSYGNYGLKLASYTSGKGRISVWLSGYEPCHNAEEIIDEKAYNADGDLNNPSSSVFCMHGAGTIIPWDKVREYMHVESGWKDSCEDYDGDEKLKKDVKKIKKEVVDTRNFKEREKDRLAADAELKMIFERTYGPIRKKVYNNDDSTVRVEKSDKKPYIPRSKRQGVQKEYLLVDGYNIIFAWDKLRKLAEEDLKAARDSLLDILSNYAGMSGYRTIAVFDAYKVPGGTRHIYKYNNIDVVFTKEAETADLYIEQTAHDLGKNYSVTVASSDAIEQVIVWGAGAKRLSAMNFFEMVKAAEREMEEKLLKPLNVTK